MPERAWVGHYAGVLTGFDRTWESKSRYAMDWFYPILAGVVTGPSARERLDQRWHEFVEPGIGCRCENHQPWADRRGVLRIGVGAAGGGASPAGAGTLQLVGPVARYGWRLVDRLSV